ncbi:MAG TPA: SAM-dependent methyltransferase [Thiobacillaceae bacterium]|nr:SAM-dependent methyltransferase [Thiobacillaceae bacterium]
MPPLPPPSDDARANSDLLLARMRGAIEAAGGWLSFARYMELALYAPGLGYYSGGARKFGVAGDFVTAPEISPLFGRVLGRQLAQVLEQCGGGVLELGAGTGKLAAQVLEELGRLGGTAFYSILEVSGEMRQRQQETLAQSGLAGQVTWLDTLPEKLAGVIFGNEVLDALPAHLIRWTEQGPVERGVIWQDDRLHWQERPIADAALLARAAALELPPGYVSEINLAAPALVRELGQRLQAGLLLFIDYGYGRSEYYHPQRRVGTLRAHYRHHALDDPFHLPGLTDLSVHVDFTAVAEAGLEAGLDLLGYTSQAHFLLNGGVTDLLAETPAEAKTSYLSLSGGVKKLLSPVEMGESFKAIGLGRGVRAPSGFAAGGQTRLL